MDSLLLSNVYVSLTTQHSISSWRTKERTVVRLVSARPSELKWKTEDKKLRISNLLAGKVWHEITNIHSQTSTKFGTGYVISSYTT